MRGFDGLRCIASTSACVASSRLDVNRCFRFSVQRPPPTFSPARLITTSAFATSSLHVPCCGGCHSSPRDASRDRTVTSSPRERSRATRTPPMNPVPPETTIFIAQFSQQKRSPAERGRGYRLEQVKQEVGDQISCFVRSSSLSSSDEQRR